MVALQSQSQVGSKICDVWHVRRNFRSHSLPLTSVSYVSFWTYFKWILRTIKEGYTWGCVASHDWHRQVPNSSFRLVLLMGQDSPHGVVLLTRVNIMQQVVFVSVEMREHGQRNVGGKPGLSETWNKLSCCNTVTGLVWSHWEGEVGLVDLTIPAEASSLVSPGMLPTWAQLVSFPAKPCSSLFTCNESQDLIIIHIWEFLSGIVSALLLSHLESWCSRRTQGNVLVALGGGLGQPWIMQWWGNKEFRVLLKGSCWHPHLLYSSSVLLERSWC